MAYRKKARYLMRHRPDIVVVPECEHPDKLRFDEGVPLPTDVFWMWNNLNKGLGVFSYSQYRFQLLDHHNPAFRMIVPLAVTVEKLISIYSRCGLITPMIAAFNT